MTAAPSSDRPGDAGAENVHALNARSETRSLFAVPLRANPLLMAAVIGAPGLHLAAFYIPGLSGVLSVQPVAMADWLPVAGHALSLLVFVELFNRWAARTWVRSRVHPTLR